MVVGGPGPWATTPAATAVRVLAVDDEAALLRALRINLRIRGYQVLTARTGRQALREAHRLPPDAVILDLALPDMDGIAVIADLRRWSRAPIIVLSGRGGSSDKVGALDAGADDYVTKPFSMEELLARLRAALRREGPGPAATPAVIGQHTIDLAAHTVRRAGTGHEAGPSAAASRGGPGGTVRLTPTEWRLLEILLRHPGRLVPSASLLAEIWGPGSQDSTHYLRFHMARLRRKLEDDPARPRHLLTEPGLGYRYQP